jgi:cytochrome c2
MAKPEICKLLSTCHAINAKAKSNRGPKLWAFTAEPSPHDPNIVFVVLP